MIQTTRRRAGIVVAWGVLALGCAPALQRESAVEATGRLDAKLANSTWIEDGRLVALIVSSRATGFRLKRAYIPIEVAIANRGVKSLTLTRESFTIGDVRGRRYPLAGRKELADGYGGSVDLDRRNLTEAAPIVLGKFQSLTRVPSNFSPGFDNPIALDRVFLPRFSYLLDFLYFPTPEGYVAGEPLELRVAAPELQDPIFVRFTVSAGG